MTTELGSVQQKISCVFETAVLEEQSSKRSYQPYTVVATDKIKPSALEDDINVAVVTEKIDGTCVYIALFEGKPWLWARLDRKPNKIADRKFKKFQTVHKQWIKDGKEGTEPTFTWDVLKDFKDVPEHWIPALGVPVIDGIPQPDDNGHIPGWVPVDMKSRQHCWHQTAVDLNHGIGLVLRNQVNDELTIECVPLEELLGTTAELIGTHVNANPYAIGSKQCPLHFLVVHGSIPVDKPPLLQIDAMKEWFQLTQCGKVEGIVWHCQTGALYKLHRHHIKLPWPITEPRLSTFRVNIKVDISQYELEDVNKSSFIVISRFNGHTCDSISRLHELLNTNGENS